MIATNSRPPEQVDVEEEQSRRFKNIKANFGAVTLNPIGKPRPPPKFLVCRFLATSSPSTIIMSSTLAVGLGVATAAFLVCYVLSRCIV